MQNIGLVPSTPKGNTARNQSALVGLPFQIFTEIRIVECNDRLSPFCYALPFKLTMPNSVTIHRIRLGVAHNAPGIGLHERLRRSPRFS